ncbi:uncharacterized protein LOC144281717 [Canis aureus]
MRAREGSYKGEAANFPGDSTPLPSPLAPPPRPRPPLRAEPGTVAHRGARPRPAAPGHFRANPAAPAPAPARQLSGAPDGPGRAGPGGLRPFPGVAGRLAGFASEQGRGGRQRAEPPGTSPLHRSTPGATARPAPALGFRLPPAREWRQGEGLLGAGRGSRSPRAVGTASRRLPPPQPRWWCASVRRPPAEPPALGGTGRGDGLAWEAVRGLLRRPWPRGAYARSLRGRLRESRPEERDCPLLQRKANPGRKIDEREMSTDMGLGKISSQRKPWRADNTPCNLQTRGQARKSEKKYPNVILKMGGCDCTCGTHSFGPRCGSCFLPSLLACDVLREHESWNCYAIAATLRKMSLNMKDAGRRLLRYLLRKGTRAQKDCETPRLNQT